MKLTLEHWLVETCSPVKSGNSLELRVVRTPVDRLHGRRMPRVDVTSSHDDLGLWVCLNKLLGERNGGPVADSLAVTEKLVPLLASESANTVVLGSKGILPHEAVWRVLNRGGHHVVAVVETKLLESSAERGSTSSAETKSQNSHWYDTVTLAAVDVSVGGEDVSHRLWCVWKVCVGHCCEKLVVGNSISIRIESRYESWS